MSAAEQYIKSMQTLGAVGRSISRTNKKLDTTVTDEDKQHINACEQWMQSMQMRKAGGRSYRTYSNIIYDIWQQCKR